MHYNKKKLVFLLMILGCIMMLAGCGKQETTTEEESVEKYSDTGFAMGTTISETVYCTGSEAGEKACDKIISILKDVEDNQISWRVKGSEIYKLNHTDKTTTLDKETYGWLEESMNIAKDSDQALDPGIGVLDQLWDIAGDNPRVPEQSEIDEAMKSIDADDIHLEDDQKVTTDTSEVQVDLGAVGKGIGADKAMEYLESNDDISGAVIAVGGSICAYGEKPDGSDWMVGVQDPRDDDGVVMGAVSVKGGTYVSTSGDYEKYIEKDGKRYHHILDRETGYPSDSGLISVTVICPNGLDSDGLSTACFVLGIDKSLDLLEKYDAEAVFIDSDKNVYVTDGADFELQNSEDYTIKELK